MPLFDAVERTETDVALHSESDFAYLNRTARPKGANIRDTLEGWFQRFPREHQADILGRIRSGRDDQFHSAMFEMTLHELFLRLGCTVVIHPTIANTNRHPDFRVETPNGTHTYVEAIVVRGESTADAAEDARKHTIYDLLNEMDSPNFFFAIDSCEAGKQQPSARDMRGFLEAKLRTLNPDEMEKKSEDGGIAALPHWKYEKNGWRIVFYPIPKSAKSRGKPGVRPLGIISGKAGWVDDRTPLKGSILEKAKSYGKLEAPFLIAVNTLAPTSDNTDVIDALFGRENFSFDLNNPSRPPIRKREPDGIWNGPKGKRYTRVSGVLFTFRVQPWALAVAGSRLYHNPWAAQPYEGPLNRLPTARPGAENNMECFAGESLGQILGIPEGWPGD